MVSGWRDWRPECFRHKRPGVGAPALTCRPPNLHGGGSRSGNGPSRNPLAEIPVPPRYHIAIAGARHCDGGNGGLRQPDGPRRPRYGYQQHPVPSRETARSPDGPSLVLTDHHQCPCNWCNTVSWYKRRSQPRARPSLCRRGRQDSPLSGVDTKHEWPREGR